MEATSHLSPAISLDTMSSPPQFLKPEDLHTDASQSPAYDGDGAQFRSAMMQTSPPPVVVHSKPAKKRKSWGQVLPDPKTTLPPRKRAKTDDEKEQRRIERIKRNRAAAHNSRERKRQETETLAVALARANAELSAYRDLHGPLPAHIVLPEVTISTDAETPAPSLVESYGTQEPETSPETPPYEPNHIITTIKEEPTENALSHFPPAIDNLDLKSSLSHLDLTQHSAAMLCDLQCRSSAVSSPTTSSPASTTSTSPAFWASLFLQLMTFQLQTSYKTILLALWTITPSRMARLMQASILRSTSRSTSSSTTPLLLRSMAMARFNAATGRRQQGALLRALRRLPDGETDRARIQAAAARQYLGYQRRKALGAQDRSEPNGSGNEKDGV